MKCFRTLKPNTLIFLLKKMREAFVSYSFLTKKFGIFEILTFKSFYDTLTNNAVSFEQLVPEEFHYDQIN